MAGGITPPKTPAGVSDFWAKYTEWLKAQGAISPDLDPPTPAPAGTGGLQNLDLSKLQEAFKAPAQQHTPEQENRSYTTGFMNQYGWGPDDIGKPLFYDNKLNQLILDPQTPTTNQGTSPDRFVEQTDAYNERYRQIYYDPFTGGQSFRPSPVPMVFGMDLEDVTGQLESELEDWMRTVTPTDELLFLQRQAENAQYRTVKREKQDFLEMLEAQRKGKDLLDDIIELEQAQDELKRQGTLIPTYGDVTTDPSGLVNDKFRAEADRLRAEFVGNAYELDKLYATYAENPALFQYKDMNEQARTMFTEPYENLSFGQKVAYVVRRPSHWAKTAIGIQEEKGRTFVPFLYDFFHLGAQALGIPLAAAIEPLGTASVKSERLIVMRDQADWDEIVRGSDLMGVLQPFVHLVDFATKLPNPVDFTMNWLDALLGNAKDLVTGDYTRGSLHDNIDNLKAAWDQAQLSTTAVFDSIIDGDPTTQTFGPIEFMFWDDDTLQGNIDLLEAWIDDGEPFGALEVWSWVVKNPEDYLEMYQREMDMRNADKRRAELEEENFGEAFGMLAKANENILNIPTSEWQEKYFDVHDDARELIEEGIRAHVSRTDVENHGWLYSYRLTTDGDVREERYITALTQFMMVNLRFPEPWEEEQIADHFADPAAEFVGEIVFDPLNLADVLIPVGVWGQLFDVTKFVGKSVLGDVGFVAFKGLEKVSPDLAQWGVGFFKNLSYRSQAITLKHWGLEVLQSLARKNTSTDELAAALAALLDESADIGNRFARRLTPRNRQLLLNTIKTLGIEDVQKGVEQLQNFIQIAKSKSAYDELLRLANDDAAWARLVANAGADQADNMILKNYLEAFAERPGNVIDNFGDLLEDAYLANKRIPGTTMLDQGFVGFLNKNTALGRGEMVKLFPGVINKGLKMKHIEAITEFWSMIMSGWKSAILTLRPGFSVINYIDSGFRAFNAGANLFEDIGTMITRGRIPGFPDELYSRFFAIDIPGLGKIAQRMAEGWKPRGGLAGIFGEVYKATDGSVIMKAGEAARAVNTAFEFQFAAQVYARHFSDNWALAERLLRVELQARREAIHPLAALIGDEAIRQGGGPGFNITEAMERILRGEGAWIVKQEMIDELSILVGPTSARAFYSDIAEEINGIMQTHKIWDLPPAQIGGAGEWVAFQDDILGAVEKRRADLDRLLEQAIEDANQMLDAGQGAAGASQMINAEDVLRHEIRQQLVGDADIAPILREQQSILQDVIKETRAQLGGVPDDLGLEFDQMVQAKLEERLGPEVGQFTMRKTVAEGYLKPARTKFNQIKTEMLENNLAAGQRVEELIAFREGLEIGVDEAIVAIPDELVEIFGEFPGAQASVAELRAEVPAIQKIIDDLTLEAGELQKKSAYLGLVDQAMNQMYSGGLRDFMVQVYPGPLGQMNRNLGLNRLWGLYDQSRAAVFKRAADMFDSVARNIVEGSVPNVLPSQLDLLHSWGIKMEFDQTGKIIGLNYDFMLGIPVTDESRLALFRKSMRYDPDFDDLTFQEYMQKPYLEVNFGGDGEFPFNFVAEAHTPTPPSMAMGPPGIFPEGVDVPPVGTSEEFLVAMQEGLDTKMFGNDLAVEIFQSHPDRDQALEFLGRLFPDAEWAPIGAGADGFVLTPDGNRVVKISFAFEEHVPHRLIIEPLERHAVGEIYIDVMPKLDFVPINESRVNNAGDVFRMAEDPLLREADVMGGEMASVLKDEDIETVDALGHNIGRTADGEWVIFDLGAVGLDERPAIIELNGLFDETVNGMGDLPDDVARAFRDVMEPLRAAGETPTSWSQAQRMMWKKIDDAMAAGNQELEFLARYQLRQMESTWQALQHQVLGMDFSIPLIPPFPKPVDLPPGMQTWIKRVEYTETRVAMMNHALDQLHAGFMDDILNDSWRMIIDPELQDDIVNYVTRYAELQEGGIEAAARGGNFLGQEFEGAVDIMNRAMIDYTVEKNWERWIKKIYPFWTFPSRSLPFWAQTMVMHPELAAFYYKYLKTSERWAYERGAVTTRGEALPRMTGMLPIAGSDNRWWNPTFWWSGRMLFPRTTQRYGDVRDDQPMSSQLVDWMYEYGTTFGFTPAPWMWGVFESAGHLDPNKHPEWSKLPQLGIVPPFATRYLAQQLRKFVYPNAPETWVPLVPWQDALIEVRLLTMVMEKIQGRDDLTLEQKREMVLAAEQALRFKAHVTADGEYENADAARQWLEARDAIEAEQGWSRTAGYFTGIYTKEFSDMEAELLMIRDQINMLKWGLNNESTAQLFDLPRNFNDRYEHYKEQRYYLPEGWIADLYGARRWTVTEDGTQLRGEARDDYIAQNIIEAGETRLRFEKIKQMQVDLQTQLDRFPIGTPYAELEPFFKEFADDMALLETEFPNARVDFVKYGFKPKALIWQDIRTMFWKSIEKTQPVYQQGMSRTEYNAELAEWQGMITPMVVTFATSFWEKFDEVGWFSPEINSIDNVIELLMLEATPEGYRAWQLESDDIGDAVRRIYEEIYLDEYYKDVDGLQGFDYQIAAGDFFDKWSDEPWGRPAGPKLQWYVDEVKNLYGEKFTEGDVVEYLDDKGTLNVDERSQRRAELEHGIDLATAEDEMWDVWQMIPPGQKDEFAKAYENLGGPYGEEFLDIFVNTNGAGAFRSPDDFLLAVQIAKEAAKQLGYSQPIRAELLERREASESSTNFRSLIERVIGKDYWDLQNLYYNLSFDERRTFREERADQYSRIQLYRELRVRYALDNPLYAKFYYEEVYEMILADATDNEILQELVGGSAGFTGSGRRIGSGSTSVGSRSRGISSGAIPGFPTGQRSTIDPAQLPAQLGRGGTGTRPRWPQWLLDIIGEAAADNVEQAAAAGVEIDDRLSQYLKELDRNHPQEDVEDGVERVYRTLVSSATGRKVVAF